MKESVRAHYRRLDLLFTYNDMLPGNSPLLCSETAASLRLRKKLIFATFPPKWQQMFIQQKGDISENAIQEGQIVSFMKNTKALMDASFTSQERVRERTGRARNGPRYQGPRGGRGGRGRGGRFGFNRPRLPPSQPYPNYQGFRSQNQNYQNRNYYQGNPQAQQRFPPRNYGGRYGNYQGGRNQGNRNQGNRAPMNAPGRGYYNNRPQQHYAESHFNHQEAGNSFVPEGNVPDGNQGGMPYAEAHGAGQDQQEHYHHQVRQYAQQPSDGYYYGDQGQYFDDSYYGSYGDY
mmetsp:Transcript_1730/g.3806  ORF Transcript_1730/g.3806 Transcript_1730/m.3806 type:complete len:290 (+) Transcript_1730:31-900(+)